MFGVTSIVKNSDKEKWVYRGHGIAFDEKVRWSLGNGDVRKVMIFGVDNCSSSHADNCKNNFLVLGEGNTFGINETFGALEKKFSIKIQNFASSVYITMVTILTCLSMEKKSLSLKPIMKLLTFQLNFV